MATFEKVTTSTRLWSQEVAQAEASDVLDYAGPGVAGIAALADRLQPVIYEFNNGRRVFRSPVNPYA